MAIRFGGEFRAGKPQEEVYGFLTDPSRFAPLLPDFESVTVHDARRATVNLRVGISHIRGTASMQLELTEAERPRRAAYSGKGSAPGGSVTLSAGFDLQPANGGTSVRWNGEAQFYGKLVSLAAGLIEPLARKNLQKLIDALEAALR